MVISSRSCINSPQPAKNGAILNATKTKSCFPITARRHEFKEAAAAIQILPPLRYWNRHFRLSKM